MIGKRNVQTFDEIIYQLEKRGKFEKINPDQYHDLQGVWFGRSAKPTL